MAKVNQNKVIGGLIVAVITLIVVIVIVVIAKSIFPSNDKGTSDTGVGTNTYSYTTTTTTTTPATTTTSGESTTASSTTSQSEATQSTEVSVETQTMYVQDYVYMRTGPGTDNDVIVTLSRGLAVEVVKLESGWYEVIWNGQTGYVSESYLGENPPPAQSTTTTAAQVPAA